MKKLLKKVLTLLLAVSMVFGLSGITAFAAEADDATGEDGIAINVTYDDGTTDSMTLAVDDIDAAIALAGEQTFTAVNPMGMTMGTYNEQFVRITDLLSAYLGLDDVESITVGGYTSGEEYTSPMNTPFSYDLDNAWLYRTDSGYSFAVDGGLMLLWNVGTVDEIAVAASAAEEPGEEEGSIPVYQDGEQAGELLLSDIAAAFEDPEMYEIKNMTSTSPMNGGVMNEYNNLKVVNIAKLLDVYLGISADEIAELNLSLECTRQSAMSGDYTFSPEEAYLYEYNPSGYDNPYGLAVDGALQPRWYSIVTGIGVLSVEPEASEYITVIVGDNEYQLTNSDIDAAIAAAPEQTFDRITPMGSGGSMTAQYVLIKELLEDCLGLTDITEITVSRGDVSFTSGEEYTAMGSGAYSFDVDNAWLYAAEDGGYAFAVDGGLMMFWVSMSSVDTIAAVATEPIEEEGLTVNVRYADGTTGELLLKGSDIDAALAASDIYELNQGGTMVEGPFVRIVDLLSEYCGLDADEISALTIDSTDNWHASTDDTYGVDKFYLYDGGGYYRLAIDGAGKSSWIKYVGTINVTLGEVEEENDIVIDVTYTNGTTDTMTLADSDIGAAIAVAEQQTFTAVNPMGMTMGTYSEQFVRITDLLSEYLGLDNVESITVGGYTSGEEYTSPMNTPFSYDLDNAWLYKTDSGYSFAVDGGLMLLWNVGTVKEIAVVVSDEEEPVAVDKTELEEAITDAEALNPEDYTEESWSAVDAALQAAQDVMDDPDATQEDVDNATVDLVTAVENLEKPDVPTEVNKSELLAEYTEDMGVDDSNYTPASWQVFADALDAAQSVLMDPDATQDEVDDALSALQAAKANLAEKPDKEVLEKAISDADALNESDYTPESWEALQTALDTAKAVDTDENVTRDNVDAATMELVSALANLHFAEEPPAVQPDKTDLLNEYVEGMKLDESDYTPESWEPFAQALADAQSVLTNPEATQEDVDAAEQALKTARDNLVENGPVKNGLCRIEAGKLWGYYVDDVVDETYTGFASNENGDWWVVDGYVKFDVNSVEKDTTGKDGDKGVSDKGTWWYVIGNKVQHDFTGLANYKNANGWWYIVDGKVDFNHNGVDKNKNGWYYVMNGKVRFDFTGLANYRNDNGWWYISGGKVMFDHNGVEKNQNGWYYVKNSKVDFSFSGIASNKNGSWYITNGKVNFSYSGAVTYNGNRYTVKGGKVS